MLQFRHKDHRGATKLDWLDSKHSFSFGEYRDRDNMGFGPLRVINEDVVTPAAGFHTHGHANMEIITVVLSGALEHKDSLGSGDVIRPGDVQVMSAGKGILHSEFNPSETEPVHLLQIWIMPRETGTRPAYQQKKFEAAGMADAWRLIVSPDGEDGSLVIKQDAKIWQTRLAAGKTLSMPLDATKKYWLQLARGTVAFGDAALTAGDGLAIAEEGAMLDLAAAEDVEALLFELPQ